MECRLRPLGFIEFFFCKTTIIRQLRRRNESKIEKNTKKIQTKTVGIWYECFRCGFKCVGVYLNACMCYSYV